MGEKPASFPPFTSLLLPCHCKFLPATKHAFSRFTALSATRPHFSARSTFHAALHTAPSHHFLSTFSSFATLDCRSSHFSFSQPASSHSLVPPPPPLIFIHFFLGSSLGLSHQRLVSQTRSNNDTWNSAFIFPRWAQCQKSECHGHLVIRSKQSDPENMRNCFHFEQQQTHFPPLPVQANRHTSEYYIPLWPVFVAVLEYTVGQRYNGRERGLYLSFLLALVNRQTRDHHAVRSTSSILKNKCYEMILVPFH